MKKFLFTLLALLFLGALPVVAQETDNSTLTHQYYTNNFKSTVALTVGQVVKADTANADQVTVMTNGDTSPIVGVAQASVGAGATLQIVTSGTFAGVIKTENNCSIGNWVVNSSVGGGHNGNVMCVATPTGAYLGIAESVVTGASAADPIAIDVFVHPGMSSNGSISPITKWENLMAQGTQAAAALSASNQTRVWGFTLEVPVTLSHIVYDVFTADTASGSLCGAFADCYDVGIFNSSGTLLADCGAAAFAATGAVDCTIAQGTVTLQPGTFYFGFTGNSTTGAIEYATSLTFGFASGVAVTGTSTNGALNSSITPPTDSWNSASQKSAVFAIHN